MTTIKASNDKKHWVHIGTFLNEKLAYLSLAYQKASIQFNFVRVKNTKP